MENTKEYPGTDHGVSMEYHGISMEYTMEYQCNMNSISIEYTMEYHRTEWNVMEYNDISEISLNIR